ERAYGPGHPRLKLPRQRKTWMPATPARLRASFDALCAGMTMWQGRRQITGRLLIATHNPGKLKEMRELLAPYGIDAVSAREFGLPEPAETGTSFAENARIKAVA